MSCVNCDYLNNIYYVCLCLIASFAGNFIFSARETSKCLEGKIWMRGKNCNLCALTIMCAFSKVINPFFNHNFKSFQLILWISLCAVLKAVIFFLLSLQLQLCSNNFYDSVINATGFNWMNFKLQLLKFLSSESVNDVGRIYDLLSSLPDMIQLYTYLISSKFIIATSLCLFIIMICFDTNIYYMCVQIKIMSIPFLCSTSVEW